VVPALSRAARWTGILVCAFILFAAAVSLRWSWVSLCGDKNGRIWLAGGTLEVAWIDGRGWPTDWNAYVGPPIATWRELVDRWSSSGVWPRPDSGRLIKAFVLPLWFPFLLTAIPTAILWRLDCRRARPGHCAKCRYNLTGNVSGRCPECGAFTPAR